MPLLDRVTLMLLAVALGCISYFAWIHRPFLWESGAQEMRLLISRWLGPPVAALLALIAFVPVRTNEAPLPAWVFPTVLAFCVVSVMLVFIERRRATRPNPKPPRRDGEPLPRRRTARR
jgi:hypothetical protein